MLVFQIVTISSLSLLSTLKKSVAKVIIQTRPWLVVENTSLHFANPISLNALCWENKTLLCSQKPNTAKGTIYTALQMTDTF